MKVGIKYCGGCNPRYDRVAAVNQLKREFPQVEFVSASGNPDCDIVFVVCGCFAACADRTGLQAKDEMITVWQLSDVDKARQKLRSVCPDWQEVTVEDSALSAGITQTEEAKAAWEVQKESLARADKAEQEEAARWMRMVMPLSGK